MYIYPAEMGTALVWNHICRETERERYIYIYVCVCACADASSHWFISVILHFGI